MKKEHVDNNHLQKTYIIRVCLLLVTFAWMIMIFNMSSKPGNRSEAQSNKAASVIFHILIPHFDEMDPNEQSKYIESVQVLVRKGAHFVEFTVLGALLCSNLILWIKLDVKTLLFLAIALGVLYSVSDEIHQLFVVGRTAKLTDILRDSVGVLIGAFIIAKQKAGSSP